MSKGETCDYGGCENEGYSTITHEGRHTFCRYHNERVNP